MGNRSGPGAHILPAPRVLIVAGAEAVRFGRDPLQVPVVSALQMMAKRSEHKPGREQQQLLQQQQ